MKPGTTVNRLVMLAFFITILLYLGFYVLTALREPFTTVTSYTYTIDDAMSADGFLAREETVISGGGAVLDPLPEEGEKVAAGAAIAVAYQSSNAAARRQEINALELELEQLRNALNNGGGADVAQMAGEITDAIVELHASVAAGSLTGLENQTTALKSLVYRRENTLNGGGNSEGLASSIQSVQNQLSALQSQSTLDTSLITAPRAGVFSGQTDGYESLLQPETLKKLTPLDLDAIAARPATEDPAAVGKLITDTTWYFICALSEADAGRLTESERVTVRFSRDWAGEVSMTVEQVGAPESGRCTVLLSSTRFLSDTTLLRRQSVEIVFHSSTGIRVPKAAIRVQEGEEGSLTGVWALVSGRAEFKPVTVLAEQDDFCVVAPQNINAKKALRAGDEIIIASEDLFDGQVLQLS